MLVSVSTWVICAEASAAENLLSFSDSSVPLSVPLSVSMTGPVASVFFVAVWFRYVPIARERIAFKILVVFLVTMLWKFTMPSF